METAALRQERNFSQPRDERHTPFFPLLFVCTRQPSGYRARKASLPSSGGVASSSMPHSILSCPAQATITPLSVHSRGGGNTTSMSGSNDFTVERKCSRRY